MIDTTLFIFSTCFSQGEEQEEGVVKELGILEGLWSISILWMHCIDPGPSRLR
jgi:hypothetical protein